LAQLFALLILRTGSHECSVATSSAVLPCPGGRRIIRPHSL